MKYWATTGFQTVSAAQDLLEFVAPSDAVVLIHEVHIGQSSDGASADSEMLQTSIIRAHSTSGSGGGSATLTPLETGQPAAGGTYERNNTTQATGGSPTTLTTDAFNVLNGYSAVFDPPLVVSPSQRCVVTLSAPADALTLHARALIDELGG
jgi:hypothetical protein